MNGLRILILEDEEIERKALTMMLMYHREDIEEIRTASNGLEAIQEFYALKPHIVITDINLPGINGLEVIRTLQEIDKNTRFIIVSAYNLFDYAQQALRMHVKDFLIKPIQEKDLNQVISAQADEIFRGEEDAIRMAEQEKQIKSIQPLLESDFLFSAASLRAGTSIPKLLELLGIKAASACIFIAGGKGLRYIFVHETRKRMNNLGFTCIGDLVNDQYVFAVLSKKQLTKDQLTETLQIILNKSRDSFGEIFIGISSIVCPDEMLREAFRQAGVACSYAKECGIALAFFEEMKQTMQKGDILRRKEESVSEHIPPNRSGVIADEIVQTIRKHYMDNITLENIAEQMNFSFYYLSRIFKQHTGMTFTEYLTNYRMEKAKELLKSSNYSVKETAYAVGFRSQGYFSKVFHKYTGFMPTEYKKQDIKPNE